MKTKESFKIGAHNIGWVSSDFYSRMPEEFESRTLGTFQKLPRDMTDAEIESELKPGLCGLGDVLAFLENAPEECKDGYSNIFYIPSFVVNVRWSDSGWLVDTWLRRGYDWGRDRRVFSPATALKNSEPKPSVLDSLDPSALNEIMKQLTRIADYLQPVEVKKKAK